MRKSMPWAGITFNPATSSLPGIWLHRREPALSMIRDPPQIPLFLQAYVQRILPAPTLIVYWTRSQWRLSHRRLPILHLGEVWVIES